MRFYEYESKALFGRHGMPLGRSGVAESAAEARRIAASVQEGCLDPSDPCGLWRERLDGWLAEHPAP